MRVCQSMRTIGRCCRFSCSAAISIRPTSAGARLRVRLPFSIVRARPTAIRRCRSDSNRLRSNSIRCGSDALPFRARPFPTGSAVVRAAWRDPWPNIAPERSVRLGFELRSANSCGQVVAPRPDVSFRGSMPSPNACAATPRSRCMNSPERWGDIPPGLGQPTDRPPEKVYWQRRRAFALNMRRGCCVRPGARTPTLPLKPVFAIKAI